MRTLSHPIDLNKVITIVYHSPDGQDFAVKIECCDQFQALGPGDLCDTSEIDGLVHFYPRGNS